jgi:hypothetical protein
MGREPKGPLGFMRIHAHTSKRDAHMGYSHAALIPMNCRKVGAKPRPALWPKSAEVVFQPLAPSRQSRVQTAV